MENLKIASKKINDMIQSLKMNNKCIPLQLNIRDSSSIKEFTQALVNDHHISNIDYVVNNAGGQFPSKLEDISENGWKAVIDLNLNGTFLFSNHIFNTFWKKSAKNIIEKNQRVIINITAVTALGMPLMGHSSAARAAVHNLTKVMTQNWSKYGVRINSVAPGYIDSTGIATYPKKFFEEFIKNSTQHIYMWRAGQCREISNVVAFLLSPAASFITGVSLRVDGGGSIYNVMLPPAKPVAKL